MTQKTRKINSEEEYFQLATETGKMAREALMKELLEADAQLGAEDFKAIKRYFNLAGIAEDLLGMSELDFVAHLGNCEDDGFPAEFDMDELLKLEESIYDLEHLLDKLGDDVLRGIAILNKREELKSENK